MQDLEGMPRAQWRPPQAHMLGEVMEVIRGGLVGDSRAQRWRCVPIRAYLRAGY